MREEQDGPHGFGEYPGLKNTARKIMRYIPSSNIYVEPFAGLGRTVEFKHEKIVCNDLSDYAVGYLKWRFGMFSEIEITQEDFADCINRWDSAETFFFIDPPWRHEIYSENDKPFCDRRPYEYYEQLLDIVENILGSWIICCDKHEKETRKILSKSKWNCKVVQSDNKVVYGKHATALICSNLFQ